MSMSEQMPTFAAAGRRYADPWAWRTGIWKHSLHTASGAVLVAAGTNSVEGIAPSALKPFVEGVGMDFRQLVATFVTFLIIGALRYVHENTKPGGTPSPFQASNS